MFVLKFGWTITDVDELDEVVGYSSEKSVSVAVVAVAVEEEVPLVAVVISDDKFVLGLNNDFILF